MTVELTRPQIEALLNALGNTTGFPDVFESVCNQNLRDINTTIRGQNALLSALGMQEDPEWKELEYTEM